VTSWPGVVVKTPQILLTARAVVFDQQSDIVWMNQYYNCGDGVVTVGESKGDTKYIVGAC
jgi:hypothetical protein